MIADTGMFLKGQGVGFSYDWLIPIGASTKRHALGKYAGYLGRDSRSLPCVRCATMDGISSWCHRIGSFRWSSKI